MAELKDYYELEVGDQFLTLDINGNPAKFTVSGKEDGDVLLEETGFDIYLEDGYYVIGNVND